LTRSPKHHLVDPALTAQILNLGKESLLTGKGPDFTSSPTPFLGALFESLATMTVRVFAQTHEAEVFHFRTSDGLHEVDLVAVGPDGQLVAIEVKLGRNVEDSDVRHLQWLKEQIGPRLTSMVVISSGSDAYRRPDGVVVTPLDLLGA
jgi:hypothetical protein